MSYYKIYLHSTTVLCDRCISNYLLTLVYVHLIFLPSLGITEVDSQALKDEGVLVAIRKNDVETLHSILKEGECLHISHSMVVLCI